MDFEQLVAMVLGVSLYFPFESKVLPGVAREVDSDEQDVEVGRSRFSGQVVDLGIVEMKQEVGLDSSAPLATLAQCELHPANKAKLEYLNMMPTKTTVESLGTIIAWLGRRLSISKESSRPAEVIYSAHSCTAHGKNSIPCFYKGALNSYVRCAFIYSAHWEGIRNRDLHYPRPPRNRCPVDPHLISGN
jgi:hypothetical protein